MCGRGGVSIEGVSLLTWCDVCKECTMYCNINYCGLLFVAILCFL